MPSFSGAASIYIDRPPEAVFSVLADPDNFPKINKLPGGGGTQGITRVDGAKSGPMSGGDLFIEHWWTAETDTNFDYPWICQESTPNQRLKIAEQGKMGDGHFYQAITYDFTPSGSGTVYSRGIRFDFPEGLLEQAPKNEADSYLQYVGLQYGMAMALKKYVEGLS
ncbi:SRPBCC family protein [Streptomyces klenkii]|uniref:SRPBCC family protein n=1 Tax=Streptomyces klenkii TaxID=1420899 RepID=UPI00341D90EC